MGLLSTIVSGFNNRSNRRTQERINERNIAFQQEVNQQNIDQQWKMWDATNEYNHPAAQMARYNEAGLNPNLIYGQSNTTAPVDVGDSEAPQVSGYMKKNFNVPGIHDFLSLLSQKESVEKQMLENEYLSSTLEDRINSKRLDVEKISTQIDKMRSDIDKNGAETESIKLRNSIDQYYADNIQPLEKMLTENKVILSDNDVRNIDFRNRILDAQTQIAEFDVQLQTLDYYIKQGIVYKNEDERRLIEQNIAESKKRIEQMNAQINESGLRQEGMFYDNFNKQIDAYNPFSGIKPLRGIGTMIGKPVGAITNLITSLLK